jgi:hypothetical protein
MAVLAAHDAVVQIKIVPLITCAVAKNGKAVAFKIKTFSG